MVVVFAVVHLSTIGVGLPIGFNVVIGAIVLIVTLVFSISLPFTLFSMTGTGKFQSHATTPAGHLGGLQVGITIAVNSGQMAWEGLGGGLMVVPGGKGV